MTPRAVEEMPMPACARERSDPCVKERVNWCHTCFALDERVIGTRYFFLYGNENISIIVVACTCQVDYGASGDDVTESGSVRKKEEVNSSLP